MRASATHAGRGLSSSLIRTTTFHIKIHKDLSRDQRRCVTRNPLFLFIWFLTKKRLQLSGHLLHDCQSMLMDARLRFGFGFLALLCFLFFVDFLKILEVPSNSVCSLARQRIEHAGDPPVQAFGVRILMTASRV